jgi:hypothetical protein
MLQLGRTNSWWGHSAFSVLPVFIWGKLYSMFFYMNQGHLSESFLLPIWNSHWPCHHLLQFIFPNYDLITLLLVSTIYSTYLTCLLSECKLYKDRVSSPAGFMILSLLSSAPVRDSGTQYYVLVEWMTKWTSEWIMRTLPVIVWRHTYALGWKH